MHSYGKMKQPSLPVPLSIYSYPLEFNLLCTDINIKIMSNDHNYVDWPQWGMHQPML